jgi:hypothetical protein
MPYKDEEKRKEYQMKYRETHPSRDRMRKLRSKCDKPSLDCDKPVTIPVQSVPEDQPYEDVEVTPYYG